MEEPQIFPICSIAETNFQPTLFNQYLSNVKSILQIIRGLNQLTFPLQNKIIFFETFFWPFYGQSFIKIVRGPV